MGQKLAGCGSKSCFNILSKWKDGVESTWHFSIERTGELLQLKAKLNDEIAKGKDVKKRSLDLRKGMHSMNIYGHLLLKLADNSDTTGNKS